MPPDKHVRSHSHSSFIICHHSSLHPFHISSVHQSSVMPITAITLTITIVFVRRRRGAAASGGCAPRCGTRHHLRTCLRLCTARFDPATQRRLRHGHRNRAPGQLHAGISPLRCFLCVGVGAGRGVSAGHGRAGLLLVGGRATCGVQRATDSPFYLANIEARPQGGAALQDCLHHAWEPKDVKEDNVKEDITHT